MPRLIRTITYTGPQKWLDSCVDLAFVSMKQELSSDGTKSITSQWRDVKAQRRAQKTSDNARFVRHAVQKTKPYTQCLENYIAQLEKVVADYRAEHDSCSDDTLGSTAPQASDRRCSICKECDSLEGALRP